MSERVSRETMLSQAAVIVSFRSTCPRAQVGSVIAHESRIISTGYNGAPHGQPHCTEVGCNEKDEHCTRAIHAELNAILHAAAYGISVKGATIYTTHFPCYHCAKAIVNVGIVAVYYNNAYGPHFGDTLELFESAGVEVKAHYDSRF